MQKTTNNSAVETFLFWLSRNLVLKSRQNGLFLRREEKRLIKRLKVVWTKQMNWLIKEIKTLSIFQENSVLTNDIEKEIEEKISKLPYKKTLAETILFSMRSVLRKAGISIVKKLQLGKFGISFDLTNKTALRFLGGKLSHELSNYRGNIHATTVKNISAILKKSAEKGLSYQKTAQLILKRNLKKIKRQKRKPRLKQKRRKKPPKSFARWLIIEPLSNWNKWQKTLSKQLKSKELTRKIAKNIF